MPEIRRLAIVNRGEAALRCIRAVKSLRAQEGIEPSKATLKQAAAIAAYHSKARKGGTVAVSCTMARFVTKPRGAEPGTVQIRKESVLKVRPALPDAADT